MRRGARSAAGKSHLMERTGATSGCFSQNKSQGFLSGKGKHALLMLLLNLFFSLSHQNKISCSNVAQIRKWFHRCRRSQLGCFWPVPVCSSSAPVPVYFLLYFHPSCSQKRSLSSESTAHPLPFTTWPQNLLNEVGFEGVQCIFVRVPADSFPHNVDFNGPVNKNS